MRVEDAAAGGRQADRARVDASRPRPAARRRRTAPSGVTRSCVQSRLARRGREREHRRVGGAVDAAAGDREAVRARVRVAEAAPPERGARSRGRARRRCSACPGCRRRPPATTGVAVTAPESTGGMWKRKRQATWSERDVRAVDRARRQRARRGEVEVRQRPAARRPRRRRRRARRLRRVARAIRISMGGDSVFR